MRAYMGTDRGGVHENVSSDFVGYTFGPRCAYSCRSERFFDSFLLAVSRDAAKRFRTKLRGRGVQRMVAVDIETVVHKPHTDTLDDERVQEIEETFRRRVQVASGAGEKGTIPFLSLVKRIHAPIAGKSALMLCDRHSEWRSRIGKDRMF